MTFAMDDTDEPRPAGPVAGQGTSSSSQAAGEDPSPTPPTGAGSAKHDEGAPVGNPRPNPQAGEGREDEAAEEVEHDLEDLLANTQRERDEYLELAKRTKADFENFRRRMVAETAAANARGKADLIREVVPVLDDLERALQAAGLDPEGDSPDGLAHGVLLVFRSLREALGRNGVEPVDPSGEAFDPQEHEAISTLPGSGAEPGTVVEVVQKGYRLGEQLVRPARVVVAE
jgi:molecular chaperone GrpE